MATRMHVEQALTSKLKITRIVEICQFLSKGDAESARLLLTTDCLSESRVATPPSSAGSDVVRAPGRRDRKYNKSRKTKLFLRDGFHDRYSGQRLLFPGVLLLLSHRFPV